jgi:hypothetical protein
MYMCVGSIDFASFYDFSGFFSISLLYIIFELIYFSVNVLEKL